MICTDNSVTSSLSFHSNNLSYFTFPIVRIFQSPAPNQEISHLKGTLKKVRDTDKCPCYICNRTSFLRLILHPDLEANGEKDLVIPTAYAHP